MSGAFEGVKTGDRVLVTFEAEFRQIDSDNEAVLLLEDGDEVYLDANADGKIIKQVEVIVPPVVTFQPGDVVKSKGGNFHYLLLRSNQYVDLYNGGVVNNTHFPFTSKDYELVEGGYKRKGNL